MLQSFVIAALLALKTSAARVPLIERISKRNVQVDTFKLEPFTEASPNTVTSNYIALRRRDNPLICEPYPTTGSVNLTEYGGIEYLTQIQINNQTVTLQVDTGSADTWSVQDDFECFNQFGIEISKQTCNFSSSYVGDFGSDVVPNVSLNITYGDRTYARGPFGYADVSIAGLTVTHQQIALVNQTSWRGHGEDAGILGLAYPALTEAYPYGNKTAQKIVYTPVFTNMFERGLVNPVFSLALQHGGANYLAFGGLPPVKTSGNLTSTPLVMTRIAGVTDYAYYSIVPDDFVYSGSSSGNADMYIVDSGSTLTYLPSYMANQINALFEPPATFTTQGFYAVNCNAVPPDVGISVGGKVFKLSQKGLITNSEGYCFSGIQPMLTASIGQNVGILGDSFMDGLVSVFDVGAAQLRLTEIL